MDASATMWSSAPASTSASRCVRAEHVRPEPFQAGVEQRRAPKRPNQLPAGTSRTITTCRTDCTTSSSTRTGNIAAPYSSIPVRASNRRRRTRRRISPPSWRSSPACACSISVVAGAGWRSTCTTRPVPRCWALPLSEEQLKVACRRAQQAGVADKVRFELVDYRDVEGRFDRIVSVGMFEHVGPSHYRIFFRKFRELLNEEGVMLLHTIGRADGPGVTDAFTARYIFPRAAIFPPCPRSSVRTRGTGCS